MSSYVRGVFIPSTNTQQLSSRNDLYLACLEYSEEHGNKPSEFKTCGRTLARMCIKNKRADFLNKGIFKSTTPPKKIRLICVDMSYTV